MHAAPPSIAPPQVRQLRDALSTAQQRATAAEARVELLQEAVRKAEERAARLEMAAASRAAAGPAGAAGEAGAGAGAADGSREAELAAEVKLLREELAAAQVGGKACSCVGTGLRGFCVSANRQMGQERGLVGWLTFAGVGWCLRVSLFKVC